MKQTAEKYLTNSMPELKREALAAHDIFTLRKVREYDKLHAETRFYFVREDESVIRDASGNEIDPATLPFPKDETSQHFYNILLGVSYTLLEEHPGDLINDIHISLQQGKAWTVIILEVPGKTEFPIPGTFDWWLKTCKAYFKSGDYQLMDLATRSRNARRLDGRPKSTRYHYLINGNRIISSRPPLNNSPYTTTVE